MQDEFERTFLVASIPEGLHSCESKEILDIYLPHISDHPQLRIRKSGDRYDITKKQPAVEGDASHQIEQTIPLTKEEFAELSTLPGKRVHKLRYYYQEDGVAYEVDVFKDMLEGLILADVEFSSYEAMQNFTPAKWLLADVTQEKFIAGGMLCGKSYEDIEEDLAKYSYQKQGL